MTLQRSGNFRFVPLSCGSAILNCRIQLAGNEGENVDVTLTRFPANSELEPTMSPSLDAAEFIRLSPPERVAKCRAMAAEAERLAAAARGEMRSSYTTLATQWSELADEMASISQP